MPATYAALLAATVLAIVIMAGVFLMAPYRRRERALRKTIRHISKDTMRDLIVPDGVDGEIVIDSLLLTPRGLLVLEIKRVDGTVFGGERLDNWTALANRKRVRFANPIALMQQRVIALRGMFRDIPVEGRVVFVGDVKLGADLPPFVTTVAGLRDQFAPEESRTEGAQIDAFYSRWDELRRLSAA